MKNPFTKGDVVICVEGYPNSLTVGKVYTVERARDYNLGTSVTTDEGKISEWYNRRFRPVTDADYEPDTVIPEDLQVGEQVFIVDKDSLHAWGMERFINDGKRYTVNYLNPENGHVQLVPERYYYLQTSLRRAVLKGTAQAPGVEAKTKAKKAKKPKVKKIPKQNVRVAMRKHVADGRTSGVCAIGWGFEDNTVRLSGNMPCHAQLGYTDNHKKVRNLVYSISHEVKKCLHDDTQTKKDYKRYVDYVISKSPWAECFKTQDVSVAMRYDILMNVSKPRNWIAGACITLREGSEYQHKLSMFTHLLDRGHNLHTAFLISRYYQLEGKGKDQKVVCSAMGGGHMSLVGDMHFDQLVKFFSEGYVRGADAEPFSDNHSAYQVWVDIAGRITKKDQVSFDSWITKLVPVTEKGEGWNVVRSYQLADVHNAATQLDQFFTTKENKA